MKHILEWFRRWRRGLKPTCKISRSFPTYYCRTHRYLWTFGEMPCVYHIRSLA